MFYKKDVNLMEALTWSIFEVTLGDPTSPLPFKLVRLPLKLDCLC